RRGRRLRSRRRLAGHAPLRARADARPRGCALRRPRLERRESAQVDAPGAPGEGAARRQLRLDVAQRRLGLAEIGAHGPARRALAAHPLVLVDLLAEEAALGGARALAAHGLPAALQALHLGPVG